MPGTASAASRGADTRWPSLVRRALGIAPGRPDPATGLRLALCFVGPIALGHVLGETLPGPFVGIGAFMVSNADLGGPYRVRAEVLCAAAGVTASIVVGMVCGGSDALAVPLAVVVAMAGTFAAALGPRAAIVGVLPAFGTVIGIGIAGSLADHPLRRAIELLIGAALAITMSLAPWLFEPLRPARRALAGAWAAVAALWEAAEERVDAVSVS